MLCSRSLALPAALLLGTLQHALAQTSSSCNPTTNSSCPTDPAFATSHQWVFNTTEAPSTSLWTVTAGTIDWTGDGAQFPIAAKGDVPTLRSEFYIFGGRFEIWMKAAPGQGIISSIMLLSDDLDEIDLEFLGSNGTAVQTNFFGKGTNDYTWETDFAVSGGTIDDYHNYTIDWTESSLTWYIDGELKRTLTPEEANNTHSYPQTPSRIFIGPWAGGDPDNAPGTIAWAGGPVNYDEGPYTMAVQSISVTDYGRGTAYSYTDSSGTWDSIEMLNTDKNSTAAQDVTENSGFTESISSKFEALPTGSKAAIAACSGAAALGLVGYAMFYCVRQRRRGKNEAAMAAKRLEDDRVELEGYKARGVDPDGFAEVQPEYDAATGMGTVSRNVAYSSPNHEKSGSVASLGAAASRPLLRNGPSGSPPGTPQGAVSHDPYSDGFSPIDNNNGFGSLNYPQGPPSMPPSGPLPGVPSRSFSNRNSTMGSPYGDEQPQRSFTNPNGGQPGGYWRHDAEH